MAEETTEGGEVTAGPDEVRSEREESAVEPGAASPPAKPARARSTSKTTAKSSAEKPTASRSAGSRSAAGRSTSRSQTSRSSSAGPDKTVAPRAKAAAQASPAKIAAGRTAAAATTTSEVKADVSRSRRRQATPASATEQPVSEETGLTDPETPPGRSPGLAGRALGWVASRRLVTALAVALVVAIVLLVVTWMQLSDKKSLDSARSSALAAAKTYAVEIASYDYRSLDQNFAKVMSNSTPAFQQSYRQSSSALKSVLVKYNATAKATVVSAGLVSASTGRAVVLLFLNQTVSNTTQKGKPTTDQSRLEITLLHSGGRWLINNVSLL